MDLYHVRFLYFSVLLSLSSPPCPPYNGVVWSQFIRIEKTIKKSLQLLISFHQSTQSALITFQDKLHVQLGQLLIIRGQMSEYQFVDSLTSCFGQRGDGSVLSADYYNPQAYNSCYGATNVTAVQAGPGSASPVTTSYSDPGYIPQNGGDHHHATHHGLNSAAYSVAAAAVCSGQSNRLSHHQTPSQVPPPLSTSGHQSYPHSQYREFSSENIPAGHHQDMVSALSDCAMRTAAAAQAPSSQYPYLEPSLLSRRNGNISSYGDSFPDITACSQINGSTQYHLNHHLASHLHHHQSRTPGNSITAAAPVPTYKWMQVKRNVPKPGKIDEHTQCFLRYSEDGKRDLGQRRNQ